MLGSQEKILEPKVNVRFFTVDPYLGCMFFWDPQKVMKIAHFGIFSQYGGSGGAETILTSKYSGSTSSVSKMVDFGPPGAEKLIFSDKTSSSLIDCSPKLIS